ncbi:APC family permease [Brevibacillus marinus]|uniref:APC family permease n=1 Tax=Brevibacillus marinus TaxID=2496837 RepID=UPI000F81D3CF|nr:APC family permease [Brevibacillus marinus]
MAKQGKSGSMKLVDFFMLGFGAMVGVGWSVAINGWFASGGGPLTTFLAFFLGTLLMIPIGFCYAELTPAMPVSGGAVAFAYRAFGTFPSFLAGWFIVLAYVTVLPWEAIYINDVLALIFPELKAGEPLYSVAGTGIYQNGLIIGLILSLLLIWINHIGARAAVKVQTYLTGLLVVVGGLVILFALLKADFANLQPVYQNIGKGTHASFFGGLVAMFAMAPFFLAGFDTIPQGAEEGDAKLNYSNLGKVLVGSILAAGGFYCLVILATGLAMPWQEFAAMDRPAVALMFTALYGEGLFGQLLYWLAMLGAIAGLLTTWNGLYLASARLLVGMSRARLIPAYFSRIHPKYGTPVGANTLCAIATLIGPFVGMGIIDPLTIVGGTAFVIGWFAVAVCAIRLRQTAPDLHRPFKMPGGVTTAWIGAIISAALILSTFIPGLPGFMGSLGVAIFVCWSVLGLLFYFGSANYRNAIKEEERVAAIFQHRKNMTG